MTASWPRFLPLTGVLFVVLAVLAFVVSGEAPGTDESPQEVLSFYQDEDTSQVWAAALLGWAALAFLFFVGVLRALLRAGEGGTGVFSTIAFGGGVVATIGMLCFAGFAFVLGADSDDLDPVAAQTLNALASDFFFPVAVGLGTLLIATGLAALRSRVLPAALAWVALVLGVIAITPLGFFAFLLFLVWTLIVSVLLWRAPAGRPSAVPPPD